VKRFPNRLLIGESEFAAPEKTKSRFCEGPAFFGMVIMTHMDAIGITADLDTHNHFRKGLVFLLNTNSYCIRCAIELLRGPLKKLLLTQCTEFAAYEKEVKQLI